MRLLPVIVFLFLMLPALAQPTPAEETWAQWMAAAREMQKQQRPAEAEIAFRQAVKAAEAFPVEDSRVLESCQALYECFKKAGKATAAEEAGALFIARLEKEYGVKDPRVGGFLVDNAAKNRNDFARGPLLFRWALTAREKELGPDDPALVEVLLGLGDILDRQSRREEAQPYLRRAVALMEGAGRPDDPRLIPALSRLAESARITDPPASGALYRRILDIVDANYVPDDPRGYWPQYFQASLYKWYQVRLPEELLIQQRLLAWFEATELKDKGSYYEITRRSLADTYTQLGYYTEARAEREWLADYYALQPNMVQYSTRLLGELALLQGHDAEAEAYYRESLRLCEEAPAKSGWISTPADALLDLAECLRAQRKDAEADACIARAKAALLATKGDVTRYTVLTGEALRADINYAESLAQKAQRTEEREGAGHYRTADAYRNQGRYHLARKEFDRAEAPLRRVLAIWEGMLGPDHRALVRPLAELASCQAALTKGEEAEGLYRRALAIAETAYGKDAPILAPILESCAALLATRKGQETETRALRDRAAAIRAKERAPR